MDGRRASRLSQWRNPKSVLGGEPDPTPTSQKRRDRPRTDIVTCPGISMPTGECDEHRDVIFCRLSSSSCDEDQMKRREFIAGTAALLVSPRHVQAQGKPRRIGYLGGFEFPPTLRSGIGEKGWIEGKNLIVDYRYFEGHAERIPALAAELVALKPDLLIGSGPQIAVALKSATATIPIVFVGVAEPVGLGLLQSRSRPGGNITGLATLGPEELLAKRIQLLPDLVAAAPKISLLVTPRNQSQRLRIPVYVPATPRQLGVAV